MDVIFLNDSDGKKLRLKVKKRKELILKRLNRLGANTYEGVSIEKGKLKNVN